MRIAIIGATSHIALNLIEGLSSRIDFELFLFARSPNRVQEFINKLTNIIAKINVLNISKFNTDGQRFDVIINCIGFGTPNKIRAAGSEIFELTERFDNAALEVTARSENCIYINFSSGAVYGNVRKNPVEPYSKARFSLNELSITDAYAIAKLNSEAKHRAYQALNIIDLRIFSFFSRHIDFSSGYLLTEMVQSVLEGKPFITDTHDLVRDFVSPTDLCSLVSACILSKGINAGFDVYSRTPVSKKELLEVFKVRYGLQINYSTKTVSSTSTGRKDNYFSKNHTAGITFDYKPSYSSLETVITQADVILVKKN